MQTTHNMNTLLAFPAIIFLLVVVRRLWSIFGLSWTSPLRHLPGPKSPSFIFGHFNEISGSNATKVFENWVAMYGKTYKYYELGNVGSYLLAIYSGELMIYVLDPLVVHDGHSRIEPCPHSLGQLL